MNSFLRETIKNTVYNNPGITFDLLVSSVLEYGKFEKEEAEEHTKDLIRRETIAYNEEKGLVFIPGKSYEIDVDNGYFGQIQKKLAERGYRWIEKIFNDGNRECSIKITRDTDCHWEGIYSCEGITTGWGRFDRYLCWSYVNDWLNDGGFDQNKPNNNVLRNAGHLV